MKIKLAALSIVIVISEIFARYLGFGYPILYRQSSAGYEIKSNQSSTRLFKTSHYNNFGMRGRDVTELPIQGTKRILTLGDSVNNGGSQINDEQTFQSQLEMLYSNSKIPTEILNASAGGWSVQNEFKWLLSHGIYGASTVVIEINEKDLDQRFEDSNILDSNVSFPSHRPVLALAVSRTNRNS